MLSANTLIILYFLIKQNCIYEDSKSEFSVIQVLNIIPILI